MKIPRFLKVLITILISELAGSIGSVFTTPSVEGWYAGIVKPALNPPAWLLASYILWVSFALYLNYTIWILN